MTNLHRHNNSKTTKRGFILPFAMLIIAILAITGLSLLSLGAFARTKSTYATSQILARTAADAGLTKGLYEMNKNLSTSGWDFSGMDSTASGTLTPANSTYAYTIQEIDPDKEYKITATGSSGIVQKTISATITPTGLFTYGIVTLGEDNDKMELEGYDVSGYNSNPLETYSGNLQLRTNSIHDDSVEFEDGITVDADIVVGPGGDPDDVIKLKDGSEITGDTSAASAIYETDQVTVPASLTSLPETKYKYKDGQAITGNINYKSIKIPKNKTQNVAGNCVIYVNKKMELEEGAELIIPEGASLTIYLNTKLEIKDKSDGIINQTENPTKLLIYGTENCTKIDIKEMGDFYGAVYAPNTNVEIEDCEDIYGAFTCKEIKLEKDSHDNNKTFYFDEALTSIGNGQFSTASWTEQ